MTFHDAVTTHFKGKIDSKTYLFEVKFLNLRNLLEISLGTIIINSQSGKTSMRLIADKDFYLDDDFNFENTIKDCLNYVNELEKSCIIF